MKIKLLSEGAKMPTKADNGAAGFDLYTPAEVTIKPGRNIVPLDIAMGICPGWEGQIRPRSGFSAKGMEGFGEDGKSLKRYDADVIIGTIDCTYRGVVGVLVKSYEDKPFVIPAGTRIAQIVFSQCYTGELESVNELDETERGDGGFGHTGTR